LLVVQLLKAYGITNWSEKEQLQKKLQIQFNRCKNKTIDDIKVEHINELSTLKS
jgi:hypothetical protein